MTKRKRRRKGHAGRLMAALFACLLVCFSVYFVAGHLIATARSHLGGDAETPAAGLETGQGEEMGSVVPANPLDSQADRQLLSEEDSAGGTAVQIGNSALRLGRGENVQLPLTGLCLGIDPGHQAHGNSEQEQVAPGSSETKAKVSSGTSGAATGTPEYAVNLDIALKLRDRLASLGAEVVMTRTTNDVDISNIERAVLCNEAGCDIVLRLHCNGSTNPNANGIGLYVTASGSIAESSYRAAELLLPAMVHATGAHPAGIFQRDSYTGLNWSTVPSILVEMGYMSNYDEDLKLEDPLYQDQLIEGMTAGLARIFGRTLEEAGGE